MCHIFSSVNIGLYSINAFRQRPFLSTGKFLMNHIKMLSNINDALGKPQFRCTTLQCKRVQYQSVEKVNGTGVGVICSGKNALKHLLLL